ncbi:hypothetical protein CRUP_019692, partial [Coryphaenoides rupestris]
TWHTETLSIIVG